MARKQAPTGTSPEDIINAKDRISATQAHDEFFAKTHSLDAVHKWLQSGKLPAAKVGGRWFTTRRLCRQALRDMNRPKAKVASQRLVREGC